MFKKYPQFSFAFAIIFLAELLAVSHDLDWLRIVSKPLITVSLMLFLRLSIKRKSKVGNRVLVGLFFSLLGDVLLMLTGLRINSFLFGLSAFLIAHLFYIAAFYLDCTKKITIERRFPIPIIMVFAFFCIAYYMFMFPYLGNMAMPVLVYCVVISIMGIAAALRYGKTNYKSFLWVFIGAILFILSDSILAYNRFVEAFDSADVMVMSTYMLAQFYITVGIVERKFVKKN